jgi:hypothetical protein
MQLQAINQSLPADKFIRKERLMILIFDLKISTSLDIPQDY